LGKSKILIEKLKIAIPNYPIMSIKSRVRRNKFTLSKKSRARPIFFLRNPHSLVEQVYGGGIVSSFRGLFLVIILEEG